MSGDPSPETKLPRSPAARARGPELQSAPQTQHSEQVAALAARATLSLPRPESKGAEEKHTPCGPHTKWLALAAEDEPPPPSPGFRILRTPHTHTRTPRSGRGSPTTPDSG